THTHTHVRSTSKPSPGSQGGQQGHALRFGQANVKNNYVRSHKTACHVMSCHVTHILHGGFFRRAYMGGHLPLQDVCAQHFRLVLTLGCHSRVWSLHVLP